MKDSSRKQSQLAAKGGKGRKKTTAKPTAATTKKRGQANKATQLVGQKLITDVLKPVEENPGISPEKKVRRMRLSPCDKKSGSVLGRLKAKEDEVGSSDSEEDQEINEVVVTAPKARPIRANRGRATYVISESDEDEDKDEDIATDD